VKRACESHSKRITVHVSEQSEITTDGEMDRVKVSDPDIIDARSSGHEGILIAGTAPGVSIIRVRVKDGRLLCYTIKVEPRSADQLVEELSTVLGPYPWVKIRRTERSVALVGRAPTKASAAHLKDLLKGFPDVNDRTHAP
jgi:Flp pilus assembly secretin CpaC